MEYFLGLEQRSPTAGAFLRSRRYLREVQDVTASILSHLTLSILPGLRQTVELVSLSHHQFLVPSFTSDRARRGEPVIKGTAESPSDD